MTVKKAANELQAIRDDMASMCPDPVESLKARVDAVGHWAAGQRWSKGIQKILWEAHAINDRLDGGSGKHGVRIQAK